MTKLKFRFGPGEGTSLAEVDPYAEEMAKDLWRRRARRRVADVRESISPSNSGALRENGEIDSFDDIVLG